MADIHVDVEHRNPVREHDTPRLGLAAGFPYCLFSSVYGFSILRPSRGITSGREDQERYFLKFGPQGKMNQKAQNGVQSTS